MFLDKSTGSNSPQVYEEGMILPVMRAEKLVHSRRYRLILNKIADLCSMPESHFEMLYIDLIDNFAEFVQLIPQTANGVLASLLNEGLVRGVTAIDHYTREYGEDSLNALNCYALFSASLLLDISKALTNQKVMITDEDGQYLTEWRPFVGSMLGLGTHYKFYPISSAYQRLNDQVTSILARQIMPESGFLWLASHWRIFADWLDALNGRRRGGGRITHVISRVLDDDLSEMLAKLYWAHIDPLENEEFSHGDKFLKWLKDEIDEGNLDVNERDSLLHVTEQGVFVDKQVFKQYVDLISTTDNLHVVFTQFGNLNGIVNRGGEYDFQFKQYFSGDKSDSKSLGFTSGLASKAVMRNGLLVKDAGLIFTGKDIPTTSPYVTSLVNVSSSLPQIQVVKATPGSGLK